MGREMTKRDWDMWMFAVRDPGGSFTVHGDTEPPDFTCDVRGIQQQILAEAARRGLSVNTKIIRGGLGVRVTRAAAGPSRFDFDVLFDGEKHQLVGGVDYHCKTASARAAMYVEAKRRGVKIRTTIHGGNLWVQMLGKADG